MPIGDSDLQATKNADLVQAFVQRELISQAVVMPSISDKSMFAVKGTEAVSFPRAGSFTVENRASAVEATKQNVTYAKDQILLDQRATISWQVDPMDDLESMIDVRLDLAGRAARSHAKYFDEQVIAGFEADSAATTTAGAISKDIILEMRQELLEAEANEDALTLLVGPGAEAALLNIAEFVRADHYGSSAIPSGRLGSLYGVDVKRSSQITNPLSYYMYDKDGYGFAWQKGLSMDGRKAPELGVGATLEVMDGKWGSAKLQNGLLLRKDNNV